MSCAARRMTQHTATTPPAPAVSWMRAPWAGELRLVPGRDTAPGSPPLVRRSCCPSRWNTTGNMNGTKKSPSQSHSVFPVNPVHVQRRRYPPLTSTTRAATARHSATIHLRRCRVRLCSQTGVSASVSGRSDTSSQSHSLRVPDSPR